MIGPYSDSSFPLFSSRMELHISLILLWRWLNIIFECSSLWILRWFFFLTLRKILQAVGRKPPFLATWTRTPSKAWRQVWSTRGSSSVSSTMATKRWHASTSPPPAPAHRWPVRTPAAVGLVPVAHESRALLGRASLLHFPPWVDPPF